MIHENSEWLPPFADALDVEGVAWEEWYLVEGALDLDAAPPEGVFYSRMSASSHTRGHVAAKDYTRSVLSWLESYGRVVVNGRRVVEMEMSKIDQHTALRAFGFDVPSTVAVIGRHDLKTRARGMVLPFITKHNQGGKGLGVRRFDRFEDFEDYVDGSDFECPVDGITLLQEYVHPAEGYITRVEIVGGEFLYALTADTSAGFELCPADACRVDDAYSPPMSVKTPGRVSSCVLLTHYQRRASSTGVRASAIRSLIAIWTSAATGTSGLQASNSSRPKIGDSSPTTSTPTPTTTR